MISEFDKKNAVKSRKVCADMAEAASAGKRVLTGREYRILDMWPRFEDGEPVMVGDEATSNENKRFTVKRIEFRHRKWMLNDSVTERHYLNGKFAERVKRLAPKVLDADGMEIKVGDSMYVANNGDGPYIVCDIDENIDRIELFWHENRNEKLFIAANRLTHIAPDSWERLEEDAEFNDETGIVGGNLDIVRRAKALAGVEVD